ncbi:hypothetical protein EX30DRAFT_393513 [Ascodesmis nigricans]|uniref:Atos-like conserved domain-containing protein n=1 Tax=Ascodesmis nigricans TaxID=341454 RepID=A0A4S2N499_9PEZI|nr:hypothetical protein EX30DRAFT_393513 [Ascodesmis nigricans]
MAPSFERLDQLQHSAPDRHLSASPKRNSPPPPISSPPPSSPPPQLAPRPPVLLPPAPSADASSLPAVDHVSSRAELIERIKAGETPSWTPARKVPAPPPPPARLLPPLCCSPTDSPRQSNRYNPNHQPSTPSSFSPDSPSQPYRALHQGIFASSPPPQTSPWFNASSQSTFPATTPRPPPLRTSFSSPRPITTTPVPVSASPTRSPLTRTPQLSSSFIFKPPTSPLVHSSKLDSSEPNSDNSSEASDSPPTSSCAITVTPVLTSRRKSLPPSALSVLQFSPTLPLTFNAQHHGPQTFFPPSPPRIRRQSTHALMDLPPASFVGSYEESILNGRMSTTPSKPLNFLAQIGVLGLGKNCKPSLRCPSHVTLPFPAYFYSVGDYEGPSPYVGQIDLDTGLRSSRSGGAKSNGDIISPASTRSERASKREPPGVGGCYRIPQRGQLQIIIKNPHKTAVKLFLVPYDLREMEAGTKTFIRQKSYSAGPSDKVAPSDDYGSGNGRDRNERLDSSASGMPEEGKNDASSPVDDEKRHLKSGKQALRYMIHLHIVCPSRGRYYLFKNIRVVFANRVPDGKELLRNEILWPEPKFSPWKPESSVGFKESPGSSRRRAASLHTNAMNGGATGFMGSGTEYGTNVMLKERVLDGFGFERNDGSDGAGHHHGQHNHSNSPHPPHPHEQQQDWFKRSMTVEPSREGLLARNLKNHNLGFDQHFRQPNFAPDMDLDMEGVESTDCDCDLTTVSVSPMGTTARISQSTGGNTRVVFGSVEMR